MRLQQVGSYIMLLILSDQDDVHIPLVTSKLEERGAEYLWFDPKFFPSEARMSLGINKRGVTHQTLCYKGREYDFASITAVWDRRPNKPKPHANIEEETHRQFIINA